MFLIGIQDGIKISMSIENSSSYQMMSRFASQFLNPRNHRFINWKTSEFIQKLIVIDLLIRSIRNFVRIDHEIIIDPFFLDFAFVLSSLLTFAYWSL